MNRVTQAAEIFTGLLLIAFFAGLIGGAVAYAIGGPDRIALIVMGVTAVVTSSGLAAWWLAGESLKLRNAESLIAAYERALERDREEAS